MSDIIGGIFGGAGLFFFAFNTIIALAHVVLQIWDIR